MPKTAILPWKVVWVTGASTGIGREIALQLAGTGIKVAASARDAGSKDKLAELGTGITAYPLDVTNAAAVAETIDNIEENLGQIDLAIFCAGTYEAVNSESIDPEKFTFMMATNYMGVVNCLAGLLPKMQKRKQGHISWIASVAGYRGLPQAAAYGPTKAALINLAESLKPELALQGIAISVINPGFVETPMIANNDFPMPFLIKPQDAARRTISGLAKGKFEIAYPTRFVAILKLARILPYGVFFWFISRMTRR
jgi:NAD(P)-dependent dehydrogenase (short-subunit alcohol dehydrogenase family)